MVKMALNIELENGRVIGQTTIPNTEENVQGFLEMTYGCKVLTYDFVTRGSLVNEVDMNDIDRESFNKAKKKAIATAKDFFYPQVVIDKLQAAVNNVQLDNIMAGARHCY